MAGSLQSISKGRKEVNMELHEFQEKSHLLVEALGAALESACEKLGFDLRCLDWFSYNPDFFIEQKNQKAA